MAMETSDWLLYGGLLVANASGGINAISTGSAPGFLATLAGYAALAVAIGAGMKLAGK